jgi:hypothetical protein
MPRRTRSQLSRETLAPFDASERETLTTLLNKVR